MNARYLIDIDANDPEEEEELMPYLPPQLYSGSGLTAGFHVGDRLTLCIQRQEDFQSPNQMIPRWRSVEVWVAKIEHEIHQRYDQTIWYILVKVQKVKG